MKPHLPTPVPRPLALSLRLIGARRAVFPALAAIPGLVFADLPTGGTVVGGAATIANVAANHQQITQTTDRTIINWQTFSIDGASYVHFIQPSSSSVVLNRVLGGSPSSILGSLSANGQVFLVNPNGVYFGPGASIDVAGLVATTLEIGNSDFMAGRHVFTRPDGAPARAEVINQGVIAAREGGYVVLAGDYAANSGVIQARLGTVALAAGNKLTLDLAGDRLVSFAVDEKTVAGLAGVANTGQLLADGGRVYMTAKVGGDLAAMVVNNEGLVQARSTVERNGEIYLAADGGGVRVAGTLDASAQPGADGGKVSVVSRGGGDTVLAGGSLIKVSGSDLAVSDAGRVYTWADGATRFEKGAAIEARGGANGGDGGFVEVSGNRVVYRGLVDARAPYGKRGTLLIDPNEIVIAQGAGVDGSAGSVNTIYEQNLETTLQAGAADVVLEATGVDAKITVADLSASGGDGILEGRNGSNTGAGLQLKVNGSGAPEIRFTNTSNTIAVDGDLFLGRTSGATAPNITVGNLVAKNITIGNSGSPVATVSVGALTATPKGSGDTSATNINITATGNIVLNGPVSVRANGSSSSGAYLRIRTSGGDITHATGSANAIVVGNGSDSAGAAARFTASNGTVSMGHVSVLSGGRAASIRIDGDQGVTLAGPITVQGLGSSSSGADLEVRANNGNISHTGGLISVTNTSPGGSGVAKACFVAGGGSCSGGGSPGGAQTITLGKVTASATGSSGRAQVVVNATGGISLNDDVTAQGGYSGAIAVSTWNNSAAIALTANKTVKATGSSGGAYVTVRANSNGTVNLSGALMAYASNSAANINVQGGTVTVGAVTAGNASPSGPRHRSYVDIQSQSGAVTLNGPITLTANSSGGSAAQLYVRSANNLDHVAGPATAISVRNYNLSNGGASASFQAVGTATMGQVNVRGYEGAKIEVRGGTGISIADDLTAIADGGGARINLRRTSGSSTSIPISLATGKSIRAIATDSPGGGGYVDINGSGGTITLNGTVTASGGSGASSGRASISVSGGDVTVGAMTATAGSSAQISVAGTNITLGGNLTAANSIQLSPNYGGGGNIVGNAYSLLTDQLLVRGTLATGTYSVTTNAATLDIQGGNAITVNAAAQAGTLTALLGGGSGSQAVGDVAITAGGALDITRFWTTGTTHLLRADTLILPGSITMPAAASVTLKPYTLSNTVGFYSATDADATIQTNYDPSSWGVLFPAGATLTIGGITGGQQTGDIHVGADGAVDLGDKNIVFSTTGQVVSHTAPTTSGTVTVVAAAAAAAAASTTGGQVDDVTETMTAFTSGLDHSSGGDAAENNGAGRSLTSLFAPGGAGPRLAPPPYEIRGGVNIGGAPPGPGDEGGGKGSRSGP